MMVFFAFSTGAIDFSLNCSLFIRWGSVFDVFHSPYKFYISSCGVKRALKPLMPN